MTPEERQTRREIAALRHYMQERMADGSPARAVWDAIGQQADIIRRERAIRDSHEQLEGFGNG